MENRHGNARERSSRRRARSQRRRDRSWRRERLRIKRERSARRRNRSNQRRDWLLRYAQLRRRQRSRNVFCFNRGFQSYGGRRHRSRNQLRSIGDRRWSRDDRNRAVGPLDWSPRILDQDFSSAFRSSPRFSEDLPGLSHDSWSRSYMDMLRSFQERPHTLGADFASATVRPRDARTRFSRQNESRVRSPRRRHMASSFEEELRWNFQPLSTRFLVPIRENESREQGCNLNFVSSSNACEEIQDMPASTSTQVIDVTINEVAIPSETPTETIEELSPNQQVPDELNNEDMCKVCFSARIECVILECGHMVTCLHCGRQMSHCPVCRGRVKRVVRTYKA